MNRRLLSGAFGAAVVVVAVMVGVVIGRSGTDDGASTLSNADIGFAQDMLAHHQQALIITGQLSPQASPEVRAVAQQISLTQTAETGQLRGWLQGAGQPEQSEQPMAWMAVHSAHHSEPGPIAMPGMATDTELTALHDAVGVANEIQFLQLMIRHHQGGIQMAQHIRQHGHNAAVTSTATQMQDEQSNEVDLMVALLSSRTAAPLPYP